MLFFYPLNLKFHIEEMCTILIPHFTTTTLFLGLDLNSNHPNQFDWSTAEFLAYFLFIFYTL
jgi:uncharacterized protein YktA (UPF0223 family)